MESTSLLCFSIILTSHTIVTGEDSSSNHSLRSCTYCSDQCEHYDSFKSYKVQMFQASDRKNTIFCMSSNPMWWEISAEENTSYLLKHVVTNQFHYNSSKSGRVVCLFLTVVQPSQLSESFPFFARCIPKQGKERTWWYEINEAFAPVGPNLNPVTSSGRKIIRYPMEQSATSTARTMVTVQHTTHETAASQPYSTGNENLSSTEIIETRTDRNLQNVQSGAQGDGQSNEGSNGKQNGHNSSPSNEILDTDRTIIYAVSGGTGSCLLLLLIIVIVLVRIVKSQRKTIQMTNQEIDEFMLGIAADKANAKGINGLFVLPYDTSLEIPKPDVNIQSTILGSGNFGQVVKGTYKGSSVAIKTLKSNASQNADYLRSLLGELKVMSYLGSHPNLAELIGAITRNIKNGEVYLIFEYCANGNAHKFVRSHRDCFVDLLTPQTISNPVRATQTTRFSKYFGTTSEGVPLTTKDLVRWAYEIASGMEHVSAKNVYHGDLAARNILLTQDLTAKVGDFGLSKQLDAEKYNCYVQKKECPLPLKWMAIESLRDLTFSIQSDVWSYGVTLWELFTLGSTPYPGMDWNFESWKFLCEGRRLGKPDYASGSLYNIMMDCWHTDPRLRPHFAQIKELMYREFQTF